jgi:cysteine desulfurase
VKPDWTYLDYAATTPLDNAVFAAMKPYFLQEFGNPSSIHRAGQKAEYAIDSAREELLRLFGNNIGQVIFTGCGTESDNLALRGIAHAERKRRNANHILISPVEHHAVLQTAQQLAKMEGFNLELLPVDEFGMVAPDDLEKSLRDDTALVSIVYANNEIGSINPIRDLARVCKKRDIPFHTDAVQAAAHLPIDMLAENVDLLSIGAHKFYGPKGVGALICRQGVEMVPSQTGGKQEGGLRAGTQNVPLIIGMAEALRITHDGLEQRSLHTQTLRDWLIENTLTAIPGSQLTGHPTLRLPNHASFVFPDVDGNQLVMLLDAAGFGVSSGSACKVGDPKPSGVLLAIGLTSAQALGSLRITLGRQTTISDLEQLMEVLPGLVLKARK